MAGKKKKKKKARPVRRAKPKHSGKKTRRGRLKRSRPVSRGRKSSRRRRSLPEKLPIPKDDTEALLRREKAMQKEMGKLPGIRLGNWKCGDYVCISGGRLYNAGRGHNKGQARP